MKKSFFIAFLLFSLQVFALDKYAIVTSSTATLVNDEGFIIDNLKKGDFIKINKVSDSKTRVQVELDGETYWSRSDSFRIIPSLVDEEISLIKSLEKLQKEINEIDASISLKSKQVSKKMQKLIRVQRWIGVQRDMAFSIDYFMAKTKKNRALSQKLERQLSLVKLEKEMLQEEKEKLSFELKEKQSLLKRIKAKIQPLKAEKSSYDIEFLNEVREGVLLKSLAALKF